MKRYIDVYSSSSVTGFSSDDLMYISDLYAQAEQQWSHTTKNILLNKDKSRTLSFSALKMQIEAYSKFLTGFAGLARSKWTEFDLKLMGAGLAIMVASLCIQFLAIMTVNKRYAFSFPSHKASCISFEFIIAFSIVAIRACSFLSNSYICKFCYLRLLIQLNI